MTSKQALRKLFKNTTLTPYKERINYYNVVKKNLELLDLLKKLINSGEISVNSDVLVDYKEIDEWLGNEKE